MGPDSQKDILSFILKLFLLDFIKLKYFYQICQYIKALGGMPQQ